MGDNTEPGRPAAHHGHQCPFGTALRPPLLFFSIAPPTHAPTYLLSNSGHAVRPRPNSPPAAYPRLQPPPATCQRLNSLMPSTSASTLLLPPARGPNAFMPPACALNPSCRPPAPKSLPTVIPVPPQPIVILSGAQRSRRIPARSASAARPIHGPTPRPLASRRTHLTACSSRPTRPSPPPVPAQPHSRTGGHAAGSHNNVAIPNRAAVVRPALSPVSRLLAPFRRLSSALAPGGPIRPPSSPPPRIRTANLSTRGGISPPQCVREVTLPRPSRRTRSPITQVHPPNLHTNSVRNCPPNQRFSSL